MPGLLEELVLVNSTTLGEYDFLNPIAASRSSRRHRRAAAHAGHGCRRTAITRAACSTTRSTSTFPVVCSPDTRGSDRERQTFLYAVVGDLSLIDDPPVTETGTLTLRYAGASGSLSGLVSVEHWECPLKAGDGVKTAEFMIDFEAVDPFFLNGDGVAVQI
jgi:hypothetical protein